MKLRSVEFQTYRIDRVVTIGVFHARFLIRFRFSVTSISEILTREIVALKNRRSNCIGGVGRSYRAREYRMIGGIVGDVSGGNCDTWDIADVSKSMGGKLELISAGQT